MENQSDVTKIKRSYDSRSSPRRSFQADAVDRQALALSGTRSVKADAAKIRGETQNDIAPDKRPHPGMYKQQNRPAANIRDGNRGTFKFESSCFEGPHILRKPLRPRQRIQGSSLRRS